ncbi:MAG: response regulator [Spirochaetaceae bacterium]|jgi:two-component system response regulator YesN|nr:response regulator [Spirochaetaceae bacterium]
MKLLILDDDVQIREGIRKGIDWKSLGFGEVRSAGDGLSGLSAARELAPDIVLSDVRMPGMDGLEFLRKVKAVLPRVKVAFISGYDDFEYLQKAIQYGADGYELKPVKMRNLFKLIEDLKTKIRTEQQISCPADEEVSQDTQAMSGFLAERLKVSEIAERAGSYSRRINRSIDYVRNHLAEDMSIQSLAEFLRISPNYFSSLFKRETGIPFNRFVNRIRLQAAVYLLEHTDQRVSEIAAHTGFQDAAYFSQVFKKDMGCSPSKYREKLPCKERTS